MLNINIFFTKNKIIILIFIISCFSIGNILFSNDGLHSWAKDFKYEIFDILVQKGFELKETKDISCLEVSLSYKTRIRRFFNPFENDKAESFLFHKIESDAYILCKMRYNGDHVKAFKFESKGVNESEINFFKEILSQQFSNYEIEWQSK